jgi:hypothetical protein
VRPGEPAVEQHEISEDPVSCTLVMEQGTPLGDTGADALSPGSSLLSGSKKAPGARPSGKFASMAATQYSAGYTKTWVTDPDPPDIDVNTVTNEVEWYWDGVYMTPGVTNWCRYTYTWAWQTGWGLHENDFRCDYNQPDYPQSWLSSNSYVHFKNGIFCAFTDTHVYYDRNRAIGWGDGRLVGQWYVLKTGNCQGLLDIHSRTERTVN